MLHLQCTQISHLSGFPTGVVNMGGGGGALQNLMGGRGGGWLESKHGESMGELKMLSKNTCERVHLMKKLLAISLQASKFTKNELFNTSFSKVLATF